MNRLETKAFTHLYVKFQDRAKYIAKTLSKYDDKFKICLDNNWEIDHTGDKFHLFKIVDVFSNDVIVDTCCLSIPIELLYATDDQIHEYAERYIKCKS